MSPQARRRPRRFADFAKGKIPAGLEQLDAETAELNYAELRKRERPFVLPLDPADPEPPSAPPMTPPTRA